MAADDTCAQHCPTFSGNWNLIAMRPNNVMGNRNSQYLTPRVCETHRKQTAAGQAYNTLGSMPSPKKKARNREYSTSMSTTALLGRPRASCGIHRAWLPSAKACAPCNKPHAVKHNARHQRQQHNIWTRAGYLAYEATVSKCASHDRQKASGNNHWVNRPKHNND